jgi:hypothetical protein
VGQSLGSKVRQGRLVAGVRCSVSVEEQPLPSSKIKAQHAYREVRRDDAVIAGVCTGRREWLVVDYTGL